VQSSLAKASGWLRTTSPITVLDASAVLLGLERDSDPAAATQRGRSLAILQRGQGPDGGWGPYVTSQSEAFDTALALLALAGLRPVDALSTAPYSARDLDAAIERGRASLLRTQNPDGSWPETTRPPNGDSYAQRISTTAWALMALLESE
jgi:squalene cyclase